MAEQISDAVDLAADLCRMFEGFRSRPYLCPAGYPTVGFGSTFYPNGKKVTLNDQPITREQAEEMLQYELLSIVPHVLALCPTVSGNTNRTAALIDFCFNLGWPRLRASTLRKRVNEQNWPAARAEILKWNKGGGKVLKGLVLRRQAEAAFLS